MKVRIAGITDLSTIDWPGKLATVVFFQGCNLRCPWCQNADCVPPDGGKIADTAEVVEHIKKLAPITDGVMLSGGEPTLQPKAALAVLKGAKERSLSCAMETNGTNPEALNQLLPYLDFVAIDVKAPLQDPELYDRATGSVGVSARRIRESLVLAVASGKEVEARTTIVPTLNDSPETIARLAAGIKDVPCLRLQPFRNQRTLDPGFQNLPPITEKKMDEIVRAALDEVRNVKISTGGRP